VTLPHTLHGQLFLLGFDRRKGRLDLDNQWRFGIALRAAMSTELYRSGHMEDIDGCPRRVGGAPPADYLLRNMVDELTSRPRNWAKLILRGQRETAQAVRQQLELDGWLQARRQRILGIIATTRLVTLDDVVIDELADRVAANLHSAIAGRPTDERLLALGLLAAAAELPAVLGRDVAGLHEQRLTALIKHADPPIKGMVDAIKSVHAAMRLKQQEAASMRV